jgi:hypothetical protein
MRFFFRVHVVIVYLILCFACLRECAFRLVGVVLAVQAESHDCIELKLRSKALAERCASAESLPQSLRQPPTASTAAPAPGIKDTSESSQLLDRLLSAVKGSSALLDLADSQPHRMADPTTLAVSRLRTLEAGGLGILGEVISATTSACKVCMLGYCGTHGL